jgi:hypothetical protein
VARSSSRTSLSSSSICSGVFAMMSNIIDDGVRNGQANQREAPGMNLKTAKQIGLGIPRSVLYRTDRVIK